MPLLMCMCRRLCSVYPATIIPIFPEKRVLNNADEGFIAERMAGLGVYIDKVRVGLPVESSRMLGSPHICTPPPPPQVAHHPVLGTSLDLLVFLDGSDAGLEVRACVCVIQWHWLAMISSCL